jgi:hypothetical protein
MSIQKLLLVPAVLLVLASCKKDKSEPTVKEKLFDLTGFNQVYTGENVNITIEHGTDFHIKAKGPINNVDKLDLQLYGEVLDISYKDGANAEVVDITITMPQLQTAILSGDVVAAVRGFQNQVGNVGFILSGRAKATADDGATVFAFDVTGNAELNLNGFVASLAGDVSLNGVVNAYGLTATRAYITAMQHAKAYVKPTNIFFGSASGDSRIYYKGDPQDMELEETGNGKIIKE